MYGQNAGVHPHFGGVLPVWDLLEILSKTNLQKRFSKDAQDEPKTS